MITMKTRQFHTMISFVCAFVCYITSTVIASAATNPEVLATGQCGDNVTYTIYSDMSMVISGTGAMWDYENNNVHINGDYFQTVQKVIVEEGVTTVGVKSFRNFTAMTTVSLPVSLTSIGEAAFAQTSSLNSVDIPSGVANIDVWAFNESAIHSISIPEGITIIKGRVFNNCQNLTSVSLPSSLKIIDEYAFAGCISLTSIDLPNNLEVLGKECLSLCHSLKNISIPASVNSIGNGTFWASEALESVTVHNSEPLVINELAFEYRGNAILYVPSEAVIDYSLATYWQDFKDIWPIGQEYTGPREYSDGEIRSNGTFTWPVSNDVKMVFKVIDNTEKIVQIGRGNGDPSIDNTFEGDIVIPASVNGYTVTKVGGFAFKDCQLSSVSFPESITEIDGTCLFEDCRRLNNVVLPIQMSSYGWGMFMGCSSLSNLTTSCLNDANIDAYAFAGTAFESFVVPDGVVSISHHALSGESVKSVVIPNTVRTILGSAFDFCTNLESVTSLNENPTEIGEGAFDECSYSQATLYVPVGTVDLYRNTAGWNQFERIVEIEGEGDKEVLATGQCGDNLTYTIYSDMSMVISGTGAMWDYQNFERINEEYYQSIQKVVIEDGVTTIGLNAFSNWKELTSVSISNTVTDINQLAFFRCIGLTSIKIPSSVNYIGSGSFDYCSGLTSIQVDEGNSIYDSRDNCNAIIRTPNNELVVGCMNTVIPNSVNVIGMMSFQGCTGLASITIPSSVNRIDYRAFNGCSNLSSIEIPNSVTSIGLSVLSDCSNLASIVVETGNPNYDSRNDCNAIIETSTNKLISGCKNTIIPDGITALERSAFSGSVGLTSIIIPNSVSSISDGVFEGCSSLVTISIPNSVTYLGTNAFKDCTSLSSVDIPNSVTSSLNQTFMYCSGLTSVTIGDGVTIIGNCAFLECSNLASVIIPNSVTTISTNAFDGCRSLTSIEIPNSVTSIGNRAFDDCYALTSVTIPNSVTSIGDYAFESCYSLASITVGSEEPVSISSNVFYLANKSTCILYVPKGSKSAYENAEYWNEFENIIEYDPVPDTDISALANAIYVEQVEGRIGGTKDISIRMKNSYPIRGFQFKLELPEGTTINGWSLSTDRLPSGATTSDKVGTQRIDGNTINVACSLNYGDATFTGSDGEIATVNVTFGEDMEVGSYAIYLTECDVNDAAGTDEGLSDIKSTLILEDYVPGDANGDGLVRIGDTTTILNYIVGNASQNFQVKAADVNGDGLVRIGDVTAVLNIIVSQ